MSSNNLTSIYWWQLGASPVWRYDLMCPAAQEYTPHIKLGSDAGPFKGFADFLRGLPARHDRELEFTTMLKRHPSEIHHHSKKVASVKRYFWHAAGSDTFTELLAKGATADCLQAAAAGVDSSTSSTCTCLRTMPSCSKSSTT